MISSSRHFREPDGVVLLTGASGVVGNALVRELADLPLVCLTHRRSIAALMPRVEVVEGDIQRPGLGLSVRALRNLLSRTRVIVHAAAITDFGALPEDIRRQNVEGTARVLDFATAAPATVHYVGSAFIARASGPGSMLPGRDAYLASKLEAERLVRSSGLPANVVRPSVVSGDSATGSIARHQGLYVALGALCRGLLPFLPFAPAALIDFVPQDLVASATGALVRSDVVGGDYWLTAGRNALSAEEMVTFAVETMGRHGSALQPPPFFDLEMVERLIVPAFVECFPPREQRRFRNLIGAASLFATPAPFPSAWPSVEGAPLPPTTPLLMSALERSLIHYWVPQATEAAVGTDAA